MTQRSVAAISSAPASSPPAITAGAAWLRPVRLGGRTQPGPGSAAGHRDRRRPGRTTSCGGSLPARRDPADRGRPGDDSMSAAPSIRESVKLLQDKGLVRIVRGKGTGHRSVVVGHDRRHRADVAGRARRDPGHPRRVIAVRAALEEEMAALAATVASPRPARPDQRGVRPDMRDLADDVAAFAAADVGFHDLVMEASGNRLGRAIVTSIHDKARTTGRYHRLHHAGEHPADPRRTPAGAGRDERPRRLGGPRSHAGPHHRFLGPAPSADLYTGSLTPRRRPSRGRPTGIHRQHHSGDERCVVAGQKGDGGSDLLRTADAGNGVVSGHHPVHHSKGRRPHRPCRRGSAACR